MGQITTSGIISDINKANPLKVSQANNGIVTPQIESIVLDQYKLTKEYDHVPCSKIVSDVSALAFSANSTATTTNTIATKNTTDIDCLSTKTNDNEDQLKVHETILGGISAIATKLTLSDVVRFRGVTSTDPASGVVTLDGIRFYISSDFSQQNNGDVFYYHKKFEHDDGTVDAKLYAYIFSDGTFNHAQVPESDHGTEIGGKLYPVGYGFYDNLSTNIHDDMVDDNAAIKMHKIDGLTAALSELSDINSALCTDLNVTKEAFASDIAYLSDCIDSISNDISTSCATKAECNDMSVALSAKFSDYVLTSNVLTTANKQIVSSTEKIPSTTTMLDYLTNYSRSSHNHVAVDITDIDEYSSGKIQTERTTSDSKYVHKSNVVTADINDCKSDDFTVEKIPCMKLLQQLSSMMIEMFEPTIGTLKLIATKDIIDVASIDIHSKNFDGWVYPNGQSLVCQSNEFQRAKKVFNGKSNVNDNYIAIPKLQDFMKLNPATYSTQSVDGSNVAMYHVDFKNGLCQHSHRHQLNIITSGGTGPITATGTVQTGDKARDEGLAHFGGGTPAKKADLEISIDSSSLLSRLNFDIVGGITTSDATLDVETYPNHDVIPVMIYIGRY